MMPKLADLVRKKIDTLGMEEAAKFFGVSLGTCHNWARGKSPSIEACQLMLEEWGSAGDYRSDVAEIDKWQGRNVIFCLPQYKTLCPDTQRSLFYNYSKYGAQKIGLLIQQRTIITEARNILAARFLKTSAEWMIMVDDDMILAPGSAEVFNGEFGADLSMPYAGMLFIDRIMESNHPIVGSLYFGRHKKGRAQWSGGFESDAENAANHRMIGAGLKPARWVGTGAIRIHRSVFEKIMDAAPEKFPEIMPREGFDRYGFFAQIKPGLGEDVSLCLRAQQVGITPMIDTALVSLHIGEARYGPTNTEY